MLDAVWIGIAFALGLFARLLGLPPLLGFLAAGFVLYTFDVQPGATLQHIADLGVTLLLFTIGLKLKIVQLLRPQVWAVATLHMVAISLLLALVLLGLAGTGIALLADMTFATALLIGFALSFSSTVFAVKVLEDKGEMAATYGRIAIGILIMQDLAAVIFLAISTGKTPTFWGLGLLLALFPLRLVLQHIMDRSGHGELLILFGLTLALGGSQVFDMVGIKGDLGALILGVLLASHRSASELAKALLGFKDVFLVGFFLSIGLKGIPGGEAVLIALLLVMFIPIKSLLYFWLLARFRMRTRTAFLSSLNLANYSEFGLIVAAIGASQQWISDTWLTTIAIALSISFVLSAPLNSAAHDFYTRVRKLLLPFQHPVRLPDEQEIDPGNATVLIFGMGRVGTGAYKTLCEQAHETVLGIDHAPEVVERHRQAGRNVIRASATDADFWVRLRLNLDRVKLVMLSMPACEENVLAAEQLRKQGYSGRIAAIAKFEDDSESLRAAGVHSVFNLYAEAGSGFAEDAYKRVTEQDAEDNGDAPSTAA